MANEYNHRRCYRSISDFSPSKGSILLERSTLEVFYVYSDRRNVIEHLDESDIDVLVVIPSILFRIAKFFNSFVKSAIFNWEDF